MDGELHDAESGPLIEIEFRESWNEWVLKAQEPWIPFDLRFKDPEPGVMGAISYARFVERKTGGLIRVRRPGRRPQLIVVMGQRLE